MLKHINLQLLAEPGTADLGTGAAQSTATETAGKTDGEKDTGKTYTQADLDKIVTEQSEKKGNSVLMSLYQQNGMTEAEAKQAMADFKAAKAAKAEKDKGDLTATQKRAEEAEKKLAERDTAAFTDLVEAKAESVAAQLGIDPAKLAFIRLDFSKVGKTETGKPKVDDIKTVLEGALKVMPDLKAKEEPIKKGVAATNSSNPGGADDARMRKAFGLSATKKEK